MDADTPRLSVSHCVSLLAGIADDARRSYQRVLVEADLPSG